MDEATRATLEERGRRYGAPAEVKAAAADVGRYAGLRIHDAVLGVPIALVHEFAPLRQWVPLAGAAHVLGVAQLRGEVLALVDLLQALTGRPSELGEWMVVLQGRGGRTAAPVSEVLDSRTVTEADLAPPGQVAPLCPAVKFVTSDLWHLLDAEAARAALDGGTSDSKEAQ